MGKMKKAMVDSLYGRVLDGKLVPIQMVEELEKRKHEGTYKGGLRFLVLPRCTFLSFCFVTPVKVGNQRESLCAGEGSELLRAHGKRRRCASGCHTHTLFVFFSLFAFLKVLSSFFICVVCSPFT